MSPVFSLKWWMTTSTDDVFAIIGNTFGFPDDRLCVTDGYGVNKNILLVAHADTVLPPAYRGIKGKVLSGTGIDDRLGCWLAYQLFVKIGCSVAITDKEEVCQSTLSLLLDDEIDAYNILIGLDRGGEDVVTYGMAPGSLIVSLRSVGFKLAQGSFSDICFAAGATAAFNVGIGYFNAHGKQSYANMAIMARQVERLKDWIGAYNRRFVRPIVNIETSRGIV